MEVSAAQSPSSLVLGQVMKLIVPCWDVQGRGEAPFPSLSMKSPLRPFHNKSSNRVIAGSDNDTLVESISMNRLEEKQHDNDLVFG